MACGHPETAAAALELLQDGGNAFDAALGGLCAAFFAEPVLASLGGGGFMLADTPGAGPVIYDFFCQSPSSPPAGAQADFHPIHADFGTTTQEFHIGRASVAVPGVAAGLFAIHRDLGRLPLRRIIEPALRLAREGVVLNGFQASVFRIVAPIFRHTGVTRHQYRPESGEDRLPRAGERLRLQALGATLEALADGGEAFFYEGELGRQICAFCREGGLLVARDLADYRVIRRAPLHGRYRQVDVFSNPAPSSGGTLVCFALALLEKLAGTGQPSLQQIAQVMHATHLARTGHGFDHPTEQDARQLLGDEIVERYLAAVRERLHCARGTTHISVADREGNQASLSVSNGEGCGDLVGDSGLMLNNMLGEEDLNPAGFHRWRPATRMTSMMAPTQLRFPDGRRIVLGSGGSNRIRTAILQVIVNRVARDMDLRSAIAAPRIHLENGLLSIEPGLAESDLAALCTDWPEHHRWEAPSLFFGGVHAVECAPDGAHGCGDARRSGVCLPPGPENPAMREPTE